MASENPTTSDLDVLDAELHRVRKIGLPRLDELNLPALHEACRRSERTIKPGQDNDAIRALISEAVEAIEALREEDRLIVVNQNTLDPNDKSTRPERQRRDAREEALATFGLAPGTLHWKPQDRRRKAADLYGAFADHYRKEPEHTLIRGIAQTILDLSNGVRPAVRAIEERATVGDSTTLSSVVQNNLSGSEDPLLGRENDLDSIVKVLDTDRRLVLIKASSGRGKSRLANAIGQHYADRVLRHRRFDYVFEISAKGQVFSFDGFADELARFLGNQAVPSAPDSSAKRSALLHELNNRRILVIVDNAESLGEVTIKAIGLLPKTVSLLFTSQKLIPPLHPHLHELDVLGRDASIDLLAYHLDRLKLGNLDAYGGWVDELLDLVGGNPLAMAWAVGIMREGISMASVVEQFSSSSSDLLKDLFEAHWSRLDDVARDGLMIAALLDVSVDSRLLASAISADTGRKAIAELWRVSLLDQGRRLGDVVRYAIHPLARQYAMARLNERVGHREDLQARIENALITYVQERNQLQLGRPGYLEIEDELDNILLSLANLDSRIAAHRDVDGSVGAPDEIRRYVDLAGAISVLLWGRGYWAERVHISTRATELAASLGEREEASRHAATVGIVKHWQGQPEQAEEWAERSKSELGRSTRKLPSLLYRRLLALIGNNKNSRKATADMIQVLEGLHEANYANESNRNAARLFADWVCAGPEGYLVGEVAVMQEIGIMYTNIGDSKEAVYWLDRSNELAKRIGDVEGGSIALSHKGRALKGEDRDGARDAFTEALRQARDVDRRSTQGRALLGLAEIALLSNEPDWTSLLSNARETFEKLGMRQEIDECDKLSKLSPPADGVVDDHP